MHITDKEIDILHYYIQAKSNLSGAIVVFSGDVRNLNDGKEVLYIDYTAYIPLAEKIIAQITEDARKKWNLQQAICIHRIGKVSIMESAVIVITSSPHRKEAYEANKYIIDMVKKEAPIWKHEFYGDGTSKWGKNCDITKSHAHNH